MYKFLLEMWQLGRIDMEYLKKRVAKNQITQEEYDKIILYPHLNNK